MVAVRNRNDVQQHHNALSATCQEAPDHLRPVYNTLRDTVGVRTPLGKQIKALAVPNTKFYLHPDRVQLYVLYNNRTEEEDGRKAEAYFVPTNLWGAPKLDALVKFGSEDAPAGQRTYYQIAVRDQVELVAHEDLVSGRCWEAWPETGIGSHKLMAEYVSIVAAQLSLFPAIPQHRGMRATGWIQRDDGHHVLVLPHGKLWGATGAVQQDQAHLVLSSKHVKPYSDLMPIAPEAKRQHQALRFVAGVSKDSIAPLTLLSHIRSMMYGLLNSDFSTMLRAPSGRGKTAISSYLRNLTGEFLGWPPPDATASFTSTAARVEYEAAQIKSLPVTIDDLVIHAGMSDKEKQEKGKALDAILRSVGNNTAVRGRMTAKMGAQVEHKIDACPVLTGEQLLPDLAQSALNRCIVLEIGEDGLNKKALAKYGDAQAPGLRGVGYGLIQFLAAQWDDKGTQLADEWRTYLAEQRIRLEAAMLTERHQEPIPDEASRLPANGAHLLLAAHLLEQYCQQQHLVCPITATTVFTDLVHHLCKQIVTICDLIGGGDGVPLSSKVLEALRAGLAEHTAFLVRPDGALPRLDDMPTGYLIDESGAQRLSDAYCAPAKAACIGAIDREKGYVLLYGSHAYRVIQRYLGKTACPTADHCWGALDRKGFLLRENQRQRTRKATCMLPGVEENRPRMLFVPLAVFFPEREIPTEFEPTPFDPSPELFDPQPEQIVERELVLMHHTAPMTTDRVHHEIVVPVPLPVAAAPISTAAYVHVDGLPSVSATVDALLLLLPDPLCGMGWAKEVTWEYVAQGMPPMALSLPSEMAGVEHLRGQSFAGVALYKQFAWLIHHQHSPVAYTALRTLIKAPSEG